MKVQGLDGKEYVLDTSSTKYAIRTEGTSKSKIQFNCGQLLRQKFSKMVILEEVHLPGSGGLKLDFMIPMLKIAIEIQGSQHGKFVEFFHKNQKGFEESQKRDADKKLWCELNHFDIYYVNSIEEMKELISD